MKIYFEYEEGGHVFDHILIATTADGLHITIGFEGLDATYVYMKGIEYKIADDDLTGFWFDFGEEKLKPNCIPAANVIQQANAQIDDIVREIEQEEKDYEAHINGLRGWR
jgi:hypothetical protein